MKLFNRLFRNNEAATAETESPQGEDANQATDFDNHLENADAELQQAAEQAKNQERQERKLIGALLHDVHDLEKPDVEVSDQDRDTVYRALESGQINTDAKSDLLRKIVTPAQRPNNQNNVLASLSSKHERRILAYVSGAGFDNWEHLSTSDLTNTLQKFPTPYELADTENSLLENIRSHNSPEKYQQYLTAMDQFKNKFYGKRFQYYTALESLQSKADRYVAEQNSRDHVLAAYHQDDPGRTAEPITEPITRPLSESTPISTDTRPIANHDSSRNIDNSDTAPIKPGAITEKLPRVEVQNNPAEKVTVRYLDAKEAKKTLKHSKIDGDDYLFNGEKYSLTPKTLEQYGLAPAYEFELQNAKVDLSKPFQVGSHTAVMAYVTTGKKTKVCSYYRSNSQGIWRYLPDYVSGQSPNETINWYGKSYDEESLNLPNATQYALELVTNTQEKINLNPVQAAHAFAGTAKRYGSRSEYSETKANHALRGDCYQEIQDTPSFNLGHMRREKAPPENLDITGDGAPDFSTSINPYHTITSLYGPISVESVRSQDNHLQYTFNRNQKGQAWLSHIEVTDSPISSTGLRTNWATTGDFGTPLYEYYNQDGGYGDHSDRHNKYVNMWQNYLSRMPIIQKYLKSRQR